MLLLSMVIEDTGPQKGGQITLTVNLACQRILGTLSADGE
jgi:hypothetical protein